MSVADSPSFIECWASRWLLKLSIALDGIDFQKEYMLMQDIQEVERHCIWSGIVYSDLQWHNIWRLLHWKQGASQIT